MPRFKVVAGAHVQSGKVYTKGQTVNSDADLSKTFRGKFEAVDKDLEDRKAQKVLEAGGQPHKEDGAIPETKEEEKSSSRRSRRHSSRE